MSNNQDSEKKVESGNVEPIWVLCRTPFTALLRDGERRNLSAVGAMPALVGLRFERGLNLLFGHVDLGNGQQRFVSLEQLPAHVQAMQPVDRARELQRLFNEVKKAYPQHFTFDEVQQTHPEVAKQMTRWQGAPTFLASGTLKELQRQHIIELRTACEKGTHKPSLEALVHSADVTADELKQLARARLTAWKQAA